MPVNKNALTRMKVLDELFSDSYRRSMKEIEETVNDRLEDLGQPKVTRRCIEKDIEMMKSAPFDAPIVSVKFEGRVCPKYEDPSFSIFTRRLTREEKSLLSEVLNTLGQFDGLDNFEWLHCFQECLDLKAHPKIISFSSNPRLKNSNLLGTLFDFISTHQVVKITYRRFNSAESEDFIVHPYLLKQYNNRWYLISLREDSGDIYTLPLDRMEKVVPVTDIRYRRCKVDLEKRFRKIVGMTYFDDRKPETVTFWVSDTSYGYVDTKPLHETQWPVSATKEAELRQQYPTLAGGTFFTIRCIPNYELIREFCAYGSNLIVLSPDEIRKEVVDRITQMQEAYGVN